MSASEQLCLHLAVYFNYVFVFMLPHNDDRRLIFRIPSI